MIKLESEGNPLLEIQEQLSLDKDFALLKKCRYTKIWAIIGFVLSMKCIQDSSS